MHRCAGGLRRRPHRYLGVRLPEGRRGSRGNCCAVIRLVDLTIACAGKEHFSGASLIINPNERIALVGANGCGKSSLIELLRGHLHPEAGEVEMPALRIGWL